VPNLIDLDVPLAQGFVFAPPRAIRPEVLALGAVPTMAPAEPQPPLAPPEPSAPLASDPQERRPFRAFLRRAG
jgi:cyclic-di-GMP phosphodiesterase TipF (flagellum assembly factor)